MSATQIQTCAVSLLDSGVCCEPDCTQPPTVAILDADLVEHTRCDDHTKDAIASKSFVYALIWQSK